MSEREKESGIGGWIIMGVIAFLVPLLYILSFGPVLGLQWRGYLSAEFLVIYAPLQWASECCQPIADGLTYYKNLFRSGPILTL